MSAGLPVERALLDGAVAGMVSVVVFTIIHDLLISDIWAMLVPMTIAGALCGVSLGLSYRSLEPGLSAGGWMRYNLLYLLLLFMLGPLSLVMFEPITTIPALVATDAPPHDLIVRALPMTATYTLAMALLITRLYGGSWSQFGAVLLTSVVLVLFLGLNISILGLVELTSGWQPMVLTLLALVAALGLVFAGVYLFLARVSHGAPPSAMRPHRRAG